MFIFYLVVLAQRADGGTAGDVEASREADGVRTGAGVGEQSACSGASVGDVSTTNTWVESVGVSLMTRGLIQGSSAPA